MAMLDEQIDRLTSNLDAVFKARIEQIDSMLDTKIQDVRELLNGLSFYGGVKATEVRRPTAANPVPNESSQPH